MRYFLFVKTSEIVVAGLYGKFPKRFSLPNNVSYTYRPE